MVASCFHPSQKSCCRHGGGSSDPITKKLILTSALFFALILQLFNNVGVVSANPQNARRIATRISGHGSSRHPSISSHRKEPVDQLLIYHDDNGVSPSLLVHSERHNTTLRISQDGSAVPCAPDFYLTEGSMKPWSRVVGLFGTYKVASGHIWVWVADSEAAYDAPCLRANPNANQLSVNDTSEGIVSFWWQICKVTELHLVHIPYPSKGKAHKSTKQYKAQKREEKRQTTLLRQALKDHTWYYSRGPNVADFTHRLQAFLTAEASGPRKAIEKAQWWAQGPSKQLEPDEKFFWNQAVLQPVISRYLDLCSNVVNDNPYAILMDHVTIATSAFCGVQSNLTVSDNSPGLYYDQLIITRRSRLRAGTRFTRRGADASGAVANYAETEQIVFGYEYNTSALPLNGQQPKILKTITSHVQTRGSIPLRWSSPTDIKTYRPRVIIGTNPLAQARAVRQHVVQQLKQYVTRSQEAIESGHPSLLFVNLVDKKSDQGRLGKTFDSVLGAVLEIYEKYPDADFPLLKGRAVRHLWFDFHAEVKAGGWDRLNSLLDETKPVLKSHGYFCAKTVSKEDTDDLLEITNKQSGIVRTNCMDCLDRTNVVQSLYARFMLFLQVGEATAIPKAYKKMFRRDATTIPWIAGEVSHRLLWADNADAVSRLYAGTPALKGDFTRTGKRTKKGALDDGMNSLQRYYLNNFLDSDRQEGIDLLTGHHPFNTIMNLHDEQDHGDNEFPSIGRSRSLLPQMTRRSNKTRRESSIVKPAPDFNWLPGDLRSQFSSSLSRLLVDDESSTSEQSTVVSGLDDVERRSADVLPWWVEPEERRAMRESDARRQLPVPSDADFLAMGNGGYMVGALFASAQKPLALATAVLVIFAVPTISTVHPRSKEDK